jgi:hypothetical protein
VRRLDGHEFVTLEPQNQKRLVHVIEGGEVPRHRVEELYPLTVERHGAEP